MDMDGCHRLIIHLWARRGVKQGNVFLLECNCYARTQTSSETNNKNKCRQVGNIFLLSSDCYAGGLQKREITMNLTHVQISRVKCSYFSKLEHFS